MKKSTLILATISGFAVNAQIDFELITPPAPAPQLTHDVVQKSSYCSGGFQWKRKFRFNYFWVKTFN